MIRYMFKSQLRDKETIFYIFLYPLFMMTIFSLAFSSFIHETTSVRLAADPSNHSAKFLNEIPIIEVVEMTKEEAVQEMESEKLVGFIEKDFERGRDLLIVKKGGFLPTIAKSVIDVFIQMERLALPIRNYDFNREFTYNINEKKNGTDGFKIVFYAFIAMVAMQSAHISMSLINAYRANQTFFGQRVEISPAKKHLVLSYAILVSLVINFASIVLSVLYCEYILKIDVIIRPLESLLILLALNLLGVTFGICVGAGPRVREGAKIAIITSSLLILGMMSGMMSLDLKNMIMRIFPWLNRFNPLNLFSDTMLRINVSGDASLFLPTIAVILAESAILFTILLLIIRRRKYDSI